MANGDCIFCKIIAKQVPSKIIAENKDVLVIQDIAPKAPVHYLILMKKHIPNIQSIDDTDAHLMSSVILMAKELSKRLPGSGAFRLISNNGSDVGQSVFHFHVHFLSGKKMKDF